MKRINFNVSDGHPSDLKGLLAKLARREENHNIIAIGLTEEERKRFLKFASAAGWKYQPTDADTFLLAPPK